jgi:hypothetical protein
MDDFGAFGFLDSEKWNQTFSSLTYRLYCCYHLKSSHVFASLHAIKAQDFRLFRSEEIHAKVVKNALCILFQSLDVIPVYLTGKLAVNAEYKHQSNASGVRWPINNLHGNLSIRQIAVSISQSTTFAPFAKMFK